MPAARGAAAQAIGRSRGGRTTKIHAICDASGRLIATSLTACLVADIRSAQELTQPLPAPKHLLADTAYDGDAFRDFLANRHTTPVIKPNPTRKNIPAFDEGRYKERNLIERAFSHLKDWRRVATRYVELA